VQPEVAHPEKEELLNVDDLAVIIPKLLVNKVL